MRAIHLARCFKGAEAPRPLQIRALASADREEEARAVAEAWTRLFPDDDLAAATAELTALEQDSV